MKITKFKLAFFLILLIGVSLRIYDIANESFWLDECISVKVASFDLRKIFLQMYTSLHPPLYYIVLHQWIKMCGDSDFAVRFLSLVFGVLAIPLTYKIGENLFGKEVGLLAAFLIAVSTFHVQFSQEGRMYSMAVFLTLCSVYLFMKVLTRRSWKYSILYIIATGALLYTHYSGILFIVAQSIIFAVLKKTETKEALKMSVKNWVMLQGAVMALCVPFLPLWLMRWDRVQHSRYWIPRPTISSVVESFSSYAGSIPLLSIFITLIFVPFVIPRKSGEESRTLSLIGANALLSIWACVPIVVIFTISLFSASLYYTKYTMAITPAFYILAAQGIRALQRTRYKIAIAVLIMLFSTYALISYYKTINKPQWKQVAWYLTANAKSGDLLVFSDPLSKAEIFDRYYFKRKDVEERVPPVPKDSPRPYLILNEKNARMLKDGVKGHKRVWFIFSHTRDPDGRVMPRVFAQEYKLLHHQLYWAIEVFLLEQRQKKPGAQPPPQKVDQKPAQAAGEKAPQMPERKEGKK